MSDHLSLEVLDQDGAIRDAAEAAGVDRRNFLRKGAIAGGGIVAGGAMFNSILSPAEAAISRKRLSKKNDIKILRFALTLEYLEAEFYKQAVDNNVAGGDGTIARFAQVVADHEATHVKVLRSVLGKQRISSPTFDFGAAVTDLATFKATAQVLEDTGVRAYSGQAANVFQGPILTAAATILSVEARHAAWIRFINGGGAPDAARKQLPAPDDFGKFATEGQILKEVKATKFIKS